jgi:pimeloyl-ACP methyl ester carboxylesterase
METFAADLRALLDQLGHATCSIVAPNLATPLLYKFAPYIADRVSVLVQASGTLPSPYAKRRRSSSAWAEGAIQAAIRQPNLKTFMVKAGIRAWRALGQRRFLKMQLFKHPQELNYILTTDHLDEIQDALETATKQGFDRITRDVMATFDDYTADIEACTLPILVFHGDENRVFPISSIRELVADFASKMTLVEVKGTGFTMFASNTDMLLEQIARFDPVGDQNPQSAVS